MAKAKEATTTALAKLTELNDVLDEQAVGFTPQIVRMKINHQTSMFRLEGLPEQKRLKGVILASRRIRVFFPRMAQDSDTENILAFTGNRPFCSSENFVEGTLTDADFDSIKGEQENPAIFLKEKIAEGALSCRQCPMDAWGSVKYMGFPDGRGKACNELRTLLYWAPGITIPIILSVPSSSIRAWDRYCSSLQAGNKRHNRVVTEITLTSKSNRGNNWSVLDFDMDDDIDEETADELLAPIHTADGVKPLIRMLIDVFNAKEPTLDDTPTNGKDEEDF